MKRKVWKPTKSTMDEVCKLLEPYYDNPEVTPKEVCDKIKEMIFDNPNTIVIEEEIGEDDSCKQ